MCQAVIGAILASLVIPYLKQLAQRVNGHGDLFSR